MSASKNLINNYLNSEEHKDFVKQEKIEADLISRMDFETFIKYNEYIMAQQKAVWRQNLEVESREILDQEELLTRLSTEELRQISQWIEDHE